MCRAETGTFPMRIEAVCRNFKFWLTLTKYENKLSQIAYNDIKWYENKAFWSKKIKSLLEQIGLGEFWMKAHYADIGIVNMIRQRLKGAVSRQSRSFCLILPITHRQSLWDLK